MAGLITIAELGAKIIERLLELYADGKTRDRIDRDALINRREELAIIRAAKIDAARKRVAAKKSVGG